MAPAVASIIPSTIKKNYPKYIWMGLDVSFTSPWDVYRALLTFFLERSCWL